MNMKKLIQKMTEIERGNTQLNESMASECGDMPMTSYPAADQGNPVTASITLNASGMSHVADLMRLLQQAGLEKAGPPPAPVMPMRTDMENLRDKMAGLEMPPSEPKPQYFDVDDVTAGGDDIHSKKEPEDIRIKDSSLADDIRDTDLEEWDNEPEEEYGDHVDMIKRLAGGINREKTQYKAAQPGDNAMAVESIKDRLYRALSEKKAKPDYLDLDGDGDRKEPMKKAIADKKKKVAEGDKGTLARKLKKTVGQVDRGLSKIAKSQGRTDMKQDTAADKRKVDTHVKSMSKDQASDHLKKFKSADEKKKTNEAELKDFKPKAVRGLYNFDHFEAPDGSFIQLSPHGHGVYQDSEGNRHDFDSIDQLKQMFNKATESEYHAPTHEIDDTARKAMAVAQKIKRKINSGEPMDDRDYNQMAELGAILSKFGTNFGPKSMKDVMSHMVQYTDDRNQEGHGYPEFNAERFKELIAMTKSTAESAVNEISPDLAKRYTKAAKMDRDFSDDSLERLSRIQRYGSDSDSRQASDDMAKLQRRNAKRQRGINRASKRM